MKKEFTPPKKLKRLLVYLSFTFTLAITACSHKEQATKVKAPLILISMDGFRWDYFDKTDTPNFDELIKKGTKAKALIPSFPSKTFPNHCNRALS